MKFEIIKKENNLIDLKNRLLEKQREIQELEIYKEMKNIEKEIANMEKQIVADEEEITKYMLDNNIKQMEVEGCKLKLKDTSRESVEVQDINLVPDEFIRIKKEVDKREVSKYYKETGVLIPGIDVIKNPKWKLDIKYQNV